MAEMKPVEAQPRTMIKGGEVFTWADPPQNVPNCPPGLEYLAQIDQLLCKQEVHLLEVFCNWEKNNKFHVFNSMGQKVYYVEEDTTCAQRQFCGNARAYTYHVLDNANREVLRLERKFKCCAGWSCCANLDCAAFESEILAADGESLGFVRQEKYCCIPRLSVRTADGNQLGIIKGNCCMCKSKCCGDIELPLFAGDNETVIGKIAKQWAGGAREFFTDADNFCCTFPIDMDVRAKAVIFGATFLIDMMFFETSN